jgi:protein TonB
MFDTTVMGSRRGRDAGRKLAALPAALAVHALVLGGVAVGQLWAVGNVPEADVAVTFFTLPPPPVPYGTDRGRGTRPRTNARAVPHPQTVQPKVVPETKVMPREPGAEPEDEREVPSGDPNRSHEYPIDIYPENAELQPPPEPDRVFPVELVSRAPVALFRPVPAYPELARRARVEGIVVLEAVIDRSGNVVNVQIVRDLRLGCGEAAREAVRSWTYEPAMLNGRTVSVRMTVTVRFELRGDS